MARGRKRPKKKLTPEETEKLKKAMDTTALKAQLSLLSGQNNQLMNTVVRYAEALGAIFAVSRPMLDQVNDTWPNLGEAECELEKDLQQSIVAFRRIIYGLLPRPNQEEIADAAHSTGAEFPEGTEGIEGELDPAAIEDRGGIPDAEERAPEEEHAPGCRESEENAGTAEGDAPTPETP